MNNKDMIRKMITLLMIAAAAMSACDNEICYEDYYQGMTETYTAVPANDFLSTIGVNSAINSRGEYLEKTLDCMKYIGARWIRSGYGGGSIAHFERLYNEAGIKFSLGLDSGGSDIERVIEGARNLAPIGALLAIEGNNEPNNWTIEYKGEKGGGSYSWVPVAELHRDLYEAVKSDPVLKDYPVWSLSETGAQTDNCGLQFLTIPKGANTIMPEGTTFADFANCHNYIIHPSWPGIHNNQTWLASDPTKNAPVDGLYDNFGLTWGQHFLGYDEETLLHLPRVTTETGVTIGDGVTEEHQALMYMSLYLAQFKRGWSYTSVYILRDRSDEAGNQSFGFFAKDYTPRLAAHYMHNLTTILADDHSIENPGSVAYEIPNKPATVHHLLMQKNDGRFELVVWGERFEGGSDKIQVILDQEYDHIRIYNPTVGTEPVETLYNTRTVSLTMTNHPYVIEFSR